MYRKTRTYMHREEAGELRRTSAQKRRMQDLVRTSYVNCAGPKSSSDNTPRDRDRVRYSGLAEALQKADFSSIQSLEEPRKRLCVIYSTVKSNIRTEEIIMDLTDCLLRQEVEEIVETSRQKGSMAGAEKLIECLLRSDKMQWPKVFTVALEKGEYGEVLDVWICDKAHPSKKDEPVKESGDENSVFTVHFTEQPTIDNNFQPGATRRSIKDFKLRSYQEELAQPAYNGKNTIICAPTGSGKTFVALSICDHHLKSLPKGQKGKVVFMATKVPVYEQQKRIFYEYFENTEYKVEGFSGEENENVPVGMKIEDSDIIILTPQILVNCLTDGSVPSLSIFTLLIFDECHNTIGHHPYNVLMFQYLDLKIGCPGEKLPQIIGLTASVGTGKSRSLMDAVIYISKLCANLDIEEISTVKKNVEELERVVYKPEKCICETRQREQDPFAEVIRKIMAEIEQMAKSVFPHIETMSNIQNRQYGTKQYEQWIVSTQKACYTLQLEDKIKESHICSALFTYTEHLRKFNDALIINDDARTKDALEFLENFFSNIRNGTFTETEQELAKKFEESKLLIATSVADEGIDIPACNLVLLYEYVGNVTKMIQVRGRGRAKDSKCFLVTSKKEQATRERNNLLCETLMNEAVVQVQKQDKKHFLEQSLRFQKDEKKQRDFLKNFKPRELSEENKRLLCLKCKTFACNTDDIRVIQVSHHTVISEDFKDRYFTKPHSNPGTFNGYKKQHKIYCKNTKCGEDWGISGTYLQFQDIPLIKIDKFVVENADGSQKYFNKWVKVTFKMKEFNLEEIQTSFSANSE
ncbi:hypothetical protein GDO81_001479 [Engystomops pustulosus]|uniref:RNA helicase n=1 Tax=Engystomops pustulosus TaxID=76066 RepID=A0AAV7DGM8_ENGPU|nr:hypothetical protein GDO81_001479 [Engystomops pustulosus]